MMECSNSLSAYVGGLVGLTLGVVILQVLVAEPAQKKLDSFKSEAVARGYAEYVTDGKVITFKWREGSCE